MYFDEYIHIVTESYPKQRKYLTINVIQKEEENVTILHSPEEEEAKFFDNAKYVQKIEEKDCKIKEEVHFYNKKIYTRIATRLNKEEKRLENEDS